MPGDAEKTHENPQEIQTVFTQGFEQAISKVRSIECSYTHDSGVVFVCGLSEVSVSNSV